MKSVDALFIINIIIFYSILHIFMLFKNNRFTSYSKEDNLHKQFLLMKCPAFSLISPPRHGPKIPFHLSILLLNSLIFVSIIISIIIP